MTRASFKAAVVKGIVKGWKAGGGYVSVPSSWKGKEVEVRLVEEIEKEKESEQDTE